MRGLQRRPGVDAELLGEPGADSAEHRQRLRLPAGGAEGGDEAGLYGLVQRRHRGGQLQGRQHTLRPAQRHREPGRRHARVEELVSRARRRSTSPRVHGPARRPQSRARAPAPARSCRARRPAMLREAARPRRRAPGRRPGPARRGRPRTGSRCRGAAGTSRFPGRERGLEQPPQRADVLLDDVERADRGVLAPDQVDQLARADRPAHPGQEQSEQIGLLPRTGVQLDAVAPQPQRTEDLQAQGADRTDWHSHVRHPQGSIGQIVRADRGHTQRVELSECRPHYLITTGRA